MTEGQWERDHFSGLPQDLSTSDGGTKPSQRHRAGEAAGGGAEPDTEAGWSPLRWGTSPASTGRLGVKMSIGLPRGEWDLQLCPLRSPPPTAGGAQASRRPDEGTRLQAGTRGAHTRRRPGMRCVPAAGGAAASPGERRCRGPTAAGGRGDPCPSVLHLGTLKKGTRSGFLNKPIQI